MTKEELIHQVLNETQTDLYNFWAMKLLKEYPEYKQKVIDNWGFEDVNDEILEIYNNMIISPYNHITLNKYYFAYTIIGNLERGHYLNWTLRKDGYK
jgi:hypothetical protein